MMLCLSLLFAGKTGAQRIMYVYEQSGCKGYDVDNVETVTINADTVVVGNDGVYAGAEIDSITFVRPSTDFIRMGWWGNVANGLSTYNCQSNQTGQPLLEMTSSDGICDSAFYYFPTTAETMARGPRKVGTKWRYVRNTLTGRRQMQLAVLHEEDLSLFTTLGFGTDSAYTRLDLSTLLKDKASSDVKRMVTYWHRPSAMLLEPAGVVIGRYQYYSYSGVYQTVTYQDSITCKLYFNIDDTGMVTGDSIILQFRSSADAHAQFEQMDTHNDEYTTFELWNDAICIRENFEATLDEVKHWLTRFDFEMAQPIILRRE